MPALEPILTDALWAEVEALIPPPPADNHPWGPKGHRQRVSNRLVFERLLLMLETSHSSFSTFAVRGVVSASTLRRRFREWTDAGVFERLGDTALWAYDKIVGLDLDHIAVDGFKTTAPRGGDVSGPNPTDRRKMGRNWLNVVDQNGIPLVLVPASANTNDHLILEEALDRFEASKMSARPEHPMIHADAGFDVRWLMESLEERGYGYDIVCSYGDTSHKRSVAARLAKKSPGRNAKDRWHVERTNSWFRDFGRIARCPERRIEAVQAWMDPAQAIIVLRCLIREAWYRYRWEGRPSRNPFPNGRAAERKHRQRWERVHDWARQDGWAASS